MIYLGEDVSFVLSNMQETKNIDIDNIYLLPVITALHSDRKTKNGTIYTEKCLIGGEVHPITNSVSGVMSWLSPYNKPVICNHDPYVTPVGRIYKARYVKDASGGYEEVIPLIVDRDTIEKILDRRFLTVSTGSEVGEAICNICGSNVVEEWCGHFPNRRYDDKICEFRVNSAWHVELSYVNIPSDQNAMIRKINMIDKKDVSSLKIGFINAKTEKIDTFDSNFTLNLEEERDNIFAFLKENANIKKAKIFKMGGFMKEMLEEKRTFSEEKEDENNENSSENSRDEEAIDKADTENNENSSEEKKDDNNNEADSSGMVESKSEATDIKMKDINLLSSLIEKLILKIEELSERRDSISKELEEKIESSVKLIHNLLDQSSKINSYKEIVNEKEIQISKLEEEKLNMEKLRDEVIAFIREVLGVEADTEIDIADGLNKIRSMIKDLKRSQVNLTQKSLVDLPFCTTENKESESKDVYVIFRSLLRGNNKRD